MRNIAKPAVRKLYPQNDAIWQDDGATIHRTPEVLAEVDRAFSERIPVELRAAKFDDCWPIESVWGIITERLKGEHFESVDGLKQRLCELWRGISRRTCRNLIMSIPKRCRKIVLKEGQRLSRDDYRRE